MTETGDLAVYVHWPFCAAKCPYCDFNVHIRENVDQTAWAAAFKRAIHTYAGRLGPRRVGSIYFGGGTPSLMAPASVAAIIDAIARAWPLSADAEVSLEANPNDRRRFADLRAAGINRLSLGVQAFDDAALRFLGRDHDAAGARAALDAAQSIFARVSFDLIYARPEQTLDLWRDELAQAFAYEPGHLSLYQLSIERGTAFFDAVRRGAFAVPDADAGADFYQVTQEACADAGLPAYEVSNHARPGEACRYNLACWTGGDYVGLGPGAHGRITLDGVRHATRDHRKPETWLDAVAREGAGVESDEALAPETAIEEAILLGLRMTSGVDRTAFRARFGRDVAECVDPRRLTDLRADGLVELDEAALRATDAGRPLLDAILGALLA